MVLCHIKWIKRHSICKFWIIVLFNYHNLSAKNWELINLFYFWCTRFYLEILYVIFIIYVVNVAGWGTFYFWWWFKSTLLSTLKKETLEWTNIPIPNSTSWDSLLRRENEISFPFHRMTISTYIFNEDL